MRIVRNRKRRRKLQKRGESIYWNAYVCAWVWTPRCGLCNDTGSMLPGIDCTSC